MQSVLLVLLLLASVTFEEVSPQKSKITWVHNNAQSVDRQLPETVGAGCAFLDYDNDGWMDIYFVNSGPSDFFTPTTPLKNALYRNNGDGTFTDVTDKAGVAGGKFGMGVAAADFDADGFTDLYVTNYGPNILYRNNGNGTFTDVTDKAGVTAPGWSTCATWFDFDNDGKLDLFVSSFVFYDKSQNPLCTDATLQRRYYCVPRLFKPTPSRLFRNNGNGTFQDVSRESGIAAHPGKSFGAVATDVNNDGLIDLFVANDTMPNFLFVNKGKGKFEEIGLPAELLFVATRFNPTQLFLFPPWLRSNSGGSPLFEASTSESPSLSKSPTAMPRPENSLPKTAPDVALTSLKLRPVFSNISNGSLCLTRGIRDSIMSSG